MSKTYRCASTPNDCPEPIGLQDTIDEAMDIISRHIDKSTSSSGTYRKPPILISRLARGGKTTALLALFDRLKDDGKNVMFISFNGSSNFMRLKEESEEEAFYRVIAAQLVDSNGYEGKVVPDWETLDRHIGVRPFVLLVDEINALSFPVSGKLSIILKKYFLDKANRFLVISSHLPVDLELDFNRESAGSLRPCEVLSLPTCTEIKLIRKMSDKCSHISVPTVAYYGGFPSLLYSRFQNEDFDPDQWFLRSKFAAVKSKNSFLPDFVDELLEGQLRLTHADIRGFDKLASLRTIYVKGQKEQRIHWPLCYIHRILDEVVDPAAKEIVSLICNLRFHQEHFDVGHWWEEIVKIAFLLRFVQSANSGNAGPFELCVRNEAIGASVLTKPLGPDTLSVAEAKRDMDAELKKLTGTDGCYLVLFYPCQLRLEQFDGYVAFFKVANGRSVKRRCRIVGYQCKAGKDGSDGRKPSWLHKAVLFRGKATQKTTEIRDWVHASKEDVKEFLGFSLAMLYDLFNGDAA